VPDYPAGFFILPDIQPNHSAGFFILPDIRPDIRHIRPDLAGTGHPASGKKYQIRPNPNHKENESYSL